MSDQTNTAGDGQTNEGENKAPTEQQLLREQADRLGIKYSGNTGNDTLRAKIAAKLNDQPDPGEGNEPVAAVTSAPKVETEFEKHQRIRNETQAELLKLVRIRVANLDPSKASLMGEFITFQNKFVGTVKKFIPFGEATDEGYHVPYCIYQAIKDKQFNQVKTRKGKNPGEIIVEQKMVKEYAVEVLDPLTPEELQHLAMQQAARHSID